MIHNFQMIDCECSYCGSKYRVSEGTDSSTVEQNNPRYIIAGLYWNGSNWVSSDGSYAQASPFSDVVQNLDELSVKGAEFVPVSVLFPSQNIAGQVSDIQVEITGQKYTDEGTVTAIQGIEVEELLAYEHTSSVSQDTSVGVILKVQEVLKYFDGSDWVDSDGSFSQSSTESQINENLSTLSLESGSKVYIVWVLSTSEVDETPQLSESCISYNFYKIKPEDPRRCVVFVFLRDILGANIDSTYSAKLEVDIKKAFKHGGQLIVPERKDIEFDVNGYAEVSLIETETIEFKTYEFKIRYQKDGSESVIPFKAAQVPDKTSESLIAITDMA